MGRSNRVGWVFGTVHLLYTRLEGSGAYAATVSISTYVCTVWMVVRSACMHACIYDSLVDQHEQVTV